MSVPWLEAERPGAWFIVGDTRDVLRSLPDNSVDMVLTSPPFFALRSYLPSDHEDKHREIGSEPTPADFIDTLLDVAEECARVLTPTGSLCFELGDTYAGSASSGALYDEWEQGGSKTANGISKRVSKAGIGALPKSLSLIPESFRWALVYGRNPFNGRETEPWRVRNVVRWHRPNPPVGALGDKFRPATSEMVVACKSDKRWFDLDAVRRQGSENTHNRLARGVSTRPNVGKAANDEARGGNFSTLPIVESDGSAPPLDTWVIPTQPFKGSHYATWPEELCRIPILSMCPREVCRTCGEPRRRITDPTYVRNYDGGSNGQRRDLDRPDGVLDGTGMIGKPVMSKVVNTLGWTDCGHNDYRPGVVLDPFGGSGTTAKEALAHGRSGVLIDIDKRNVDLARDRVGFWLQEWSA